MEIIVVLMVLLIIFVEYGLFKQRKYPSVSDVRVVEESVIEEVKIDNKPNVDYRKNVIDFMRSDGDSVILILLCVDLNYRIGHDCNNLHKINSREYKLSLLN